MDYEHEGPRKALCCPQDKRRADRDYQSSAVAPARQTSRATDNHRGTSCSVGFKPVLVSSPGVI
eukprot:8500304-Pyramimonas_sp.AAC.1